MCEPCWDRKYTWHKFPLKVSFEKALSNLYVAKILTNVAVFGRNWAIFHCIFWLHYCIWSAVAQKFSLRGTSYTLDRRVRFFSFSEWRNVIEVTTNASWNIDLKRAESLLSEAELIVCKSVVFFLLASDLLSKLFFFLKGDPLHPNSKNPGSNHWNKQ